MKKKWVRRLAIAVVIVLLLMSLAELLPNLLL
jgi:hypothetical protein